MIDSLRLGIRLMAGQVVLPTGVFAGRICLWAERYPRTPPHVRPLLNGYRFLQRDHHTPSRRVRPIRPGGMPDPTHALQALVVGRDAVEVEHEKRHSRHAGVAPRCHAFGVPRWRPTATAVLIAEDHERG